VALFGHLWGGNAPGLADPDAWLDACHHLNLAHGVGTQAIRAATPHARIGCIQTFTQVRPASASDQDRAAADRLDLIWNRFFADPQLVGHYPEPLREMLGKRCLAGDERRICQAQDWVGVNHYSPLYARAEAGRVGVALADTPAGRDTSGIGWEVDPDAFRDLLVDLSERYGLPVHIMENGYGDIEQASAGHALEDTQRIRYMARYLNAMQEAIDEGADVRSYFAWTLLDNFEWAFGYRYRFGLVHVDHATGQRTPKASAEWYSRLIATHCPPRL
jgi:beta-glucosidase